MSLLSWVLRRINSLRSGVWARWRSYSRRFSCLASSSARVGSTRGFGVLGWGVAFRDVFTAGLFQLWGRPPLLAGFGREKVNSKVWPIAHSCGLNWGSIRAPDELVDEGHLNDRGFWVEVPHPELDRSFKYPGPAGIYNGSPWRISRRAPLIGEHNEEIYCGELGLQRTELAYLAESGVV